MAETNNTHEGHPTEPATVDEASAAQQAEETRHCGIIMPISDSLGYEPGHWSEVRSLIVRAAQQAGYTAGMVSENDGQDVIHRSIIKNIYHNDLVICDVSSLNPNVMLELGLRMANKKPLIIVFDGENTYPFDIKNVLYVSYPKGLHHFKVENFVAELTKRILQVTEAYKNGKYEPFLNHFNDVVIEASELGVSTKSMFEAVTSLVEEVKIIKTQVSISNNAKPVLTAKMLADTTSSYLLAPDELEFLIGEAMYFYSIAKTQNDSYPDLIPGVIFGNIISRLTNAKSINFDGDLANRYLKNRKHVMGIIINSLNKISVSEGSQKFFSLKLSG